MVTRHEELKRMLLSRQREMQNELKGKMRSIRAEGLQKEHLAADPGETFDADLQDELEFALVQMKAETLNKINEALSRLEEGTYGDCFECGEEIAPPRLRALPFALRCKDCEEAIEMAAQQARTRARRSSSALGFEMRGLIGIGLRRGEQ